MKKWVIFKQLYGIKNAIIALFNDHLTDLR